MTLAVDESFDALVWALRLQSEGGVNAELFEELGDSAILRTYGYPLPLGQSPQTKLPCLAIYRRSESVTDRADGPRYEVVVRFEYVMQACPVDKIGAQWTVLHRVFRALVEVLRYDGHEAVEDGRKVLSHAGVISIDHGGWTVSYDYAVTDQASAYPVLQAEVLVSWRPLPESALVPLRELWASYRLTGLAEAEQPLVRDVVSVPQADEGDGDDDDLA